MFFPLQTPQIGSVFKCQQVAIEETSMICGESFGECLALPGAHSSPPTFGRYGGFEVVTEAME